MTSAESIRASYRRALQQRIVIRRYTGTGSARIKFEVSVRGRVLEDVAAREIIGDLKQNERVVLVLAEDLIAGGLWPLQNTFMAVLPGLVEGAMIVVGLRSALDGTPVAAVLRITVTGL